MTGGLTMTLQPFQYRAARSTLGITTIQLAKLAEVSPAAVNHIEKYGRYLPIAAAKISIALQREGIRWIENGLQLVTA
jgi:DNA-binding XRE family transcriptional regulator